MFTGVITVKIPLLGMCNINTPKLAIEVTFIIIIILYCSTVDAVFHYKFDTFYYNKQKIITAPQQVG